MSYRYSRYIGRVTRQPWAILPDYFHVVAELVRERAAGHRPSDEDIAERLATAEMPVRDRSGAPSPQIAVIPIHGVIAHRADSFEASSGGTSTEWISEALKRAASDEHVSVIVLDVASPGGSVEGVPELAAEIAALAKQRRVVAQVNAIAGSAAYWLASQASEIVTTPSGQAGSIGIFMLIVDESEALEKAGVRMHGISAGDYKLEGAPWVPLSDAARAHYQEQVDEAYARFIGDVARGRRLNPSTVLARFGQGRMYTAKTALSRGMVDRIATFEDTLARLGSAMPATGMIAHRSSGTIRAQQPSGQDGMPEMMEPHDDGTCEPGYEMREDGMCHVMPDMPAGTATASPRTLSGRIDSASAAMALGLRAGVVPDDVSDDLAPRETEWSALRLEEFTDQRWEDLDDAQQHRIAKHFAWADAMPPSAFGECKLGHHRASDGAVVLRGVSAALGRLDQTDLPADDTPRVRAHLERHQRQFEEQEEQRERDERDRAALAAQGTVGILASDR